MKYRTLQVSPCGTDYIFDYESDNKMELWNSVNEQGSRWIFYPLSFIVKNEYRMDFNRKRIIETCDGMEHLKGRTITNAMQWIHDNQDYVLLLLS